MTTAHTDDTGRLAAAREKASDTAHAVIDTASDALATARDTTAEALATARDTTAEALATARDKAITAYSAALDRTGTATRAAADGIEANPLAALIGGIALGAVLGALLPRSQKEAELLGPLGTRLGDAAREAFAAAKQAGLASFDEAGLNRDAIQSQVSKLLDDASKAAGAAGGAAVQAVKKPA